MRLAQKVDWRQRCQNQSFRRWSVRDGNQWLSYLARPSRAHYHNPVLAHGWVFSRGRNDLFVIAADDESKLLRQTTPLT